MSRFTRGGGGGGGWRAWRLEGGGSTGGGAGGAGERDWDGAEGIADWIRIRWAKRHGKAALLLSLRDVVGARTGRRSTFVGDRVTYDTRMNDSTMEKEAYNVRKVDGGGSIRGVRGARNAGRESAVRSGGGRAATGRRLAHSTTTVSTSQRRPVKSTIAPQLQTQKTNDHTDQFGRLRKEEELSGGLLDLVGLDGDDGEDVTIAASCDDYDINPDGGISSVDYQRSRGRDVEEKPSAAASAAPAQYRRPRRSR